MPPETCTHHWILQTPNGPTSEGTCKRCHLTREFVNYLDASAYTSKHGFQQRKRKTESLDPELGTC